MSAEENLLARLLSRGDEVSISSGRLQIRSASGEPVPKSWLVARENQLQKEILQLVSITAFRYISFSTGHYGQKKAPGVTLQFYEVSACNSAFACFNADLRRKRKGKNGRAGEPLPKNQFRLTPNMEFYRFWDRSGIPLPPRLGRFHQYMGNLKPILFTGVYAGREKLANQTLAPLNVSSAQIKEVFDNRCLRSNTQPLDGQQTAKPQPRLTARQIAVGQAQQGLQPNSAAGEKQCGNTVIREGGCTGRVIPFTISPVEQSTEEWINDYDAASPL